MIRRRCCCSWVTVATTAIVGPQRRYIHAGRSSPALFTAPQPTYDEQRSRLHRVMEAMRTQSEVREYLRHFAKTSSQQKFAIIAVEGALTLDEETRLASSLSILHQFGLYPLVVHGGTDGTSAGNVPTIIRNLYAQNFRLVELIEGHGGRAMPVPLSVFSSPFITAGVTAPLMSTQLDLGAVYAAVRMGHLPVLGSLAHTQDGQALPLKTVDAVRLLAGVIKPLKVIFVNSQGGLRKRDGSYVSLINMSDRVQMLGEISDLQAGSQTRLDAAGAILQELPRSSSTVWVAPDELLRELFTHAGSSKGTLVRRGVHIQSYRDFADLDEQHLKETLEASFGKGLVTDYFDIVRPKTFWIYVAGDYEGLSVIYLHAGVPYLCKFAVHPKSQGLGIADLMWHAIRRDHPDLFWRSRVDNNINNWYFQRADGSCRIDRWMVFWYGLRGFDMMTYYRDSCESLPATFHQTLPTALS